MITDALNLPYGDADNLINFSVPAVTAMSLDEWLQMAGTQYFQHLAAKARVEVLKEVYNLCLQKKKGSQPGYSIPVDEAPAANVADVSTTKQQRSNTRRSNSNDEPAPVNPKE